MIADGWWCPTYDAGFNLSSHPPSFLFFASLCSCAYSSAVMTRTTALKTPTLERPPPKKLDEWSEPR